MQQNKFLILYGSQTGQAEAISEEIADNAEKINLKSERFCLNDINRKVCIIAYIWKQKL